MNAIRDLNDKGAEFESLMSKKPAAIAFFRYDSIPCDHFLPEFGMTNLALWKRVNFYRCNAIENPSVVQAFDLVETPTTILFSKGAEIGRWCGPICRETLTDMIKELLKRARKKA